jgi:hypothetical protein
LKLRLLAALLALTACQRALLEQDVRPPFDLVIPSPPVSVTAFEVLRANPADLRALTGRRSAEIPLDGDVLRFR